MKYKKVITNVGVDGQTFTGTVDIYMENTLRSTVVIGWAELHLAYRKELDKGQRAYHWAVLAEEAVSQHLALLAEQSQMKPDIELLTERGYTHD